MNTSLAHDSSTDRPNESAEVERLDKIGTVISSACAVHCIAMPFLLTSLPFLGLGFLAHGMFDIVMISIAVTLALLSLCWGHRIHGSYKTFLFIAAALSFFALGHWYEEESFHWAFMTAGGVSLASGHILNRKLCRSCNSCCKH